MAQGQAKPAPSTRAFGDSGGAPRTRKPVSFTSGAVAYVLHYVRQRPVHVAALVALVAGAAGCALGVQYVLKLLVDAMNGPRDVVNPVWTALGLFIGLIALESALWRTCGWLGCRTIVGVGVDVRLDLFAYVNGQPMRYFVENLAGSLGQRITATAGNVGGLISTMIWRVTPPVVDFIGAAIIFAAVVDGRMMVALAAFVVVVTGGLIVFGARGRRRHSLYADKASHAAGELVDVISNMWVVKAFSARQREEGRLASLFNVEAASQRASWMFTEKARLLHDIALWLMAAAMLAWAVLLWSDGQITAGDVVLVSALTFRILHGSRDMALALVDIAQNFAFVEETLKVIGQPQTVRDRPGAPELRRLRGEVAFDRVSFAYGEGRDAVHEVSLTIAPGQKVGIVGPSGAGKSTMVQLLQRLHDVRSGEIRIDGQPITQVTQDSLRAALAVAPQEITLFHRTVRDNILIGRPEASEAEIVAAARAAACDSFVSRLPEGYDTVVGERGLRLSGGQRQRIGLARAFLKNTPIIVLDEATSALDTESELEIQRALSEGMSGRTIIAVAHRLSTLASFDRILVMIDGRIIEDGSPAELRARGGVFDRMWRLQAGGMALDEAEESLAWMAGAARLHQSELAGG